MGDEIHYKEWRVEVMHGNPGWEALIYRQGSPIHEETVPAGPDRRVVIEEAKALIDKLLAPQSAAVPARGNDTAIQ